MIRVLLVDDQILLRWGYRLILEAEPDIDVIGEAGDGAEAVRMAVALEPDVVLMDVRMPNVDGIAATATIHETCPKCAVLILTTFDIDHYLYAGLQAGASGFLLKDTSPMALLDAIRAVAGGEAVLAPRPTRRLIDQFMLSLPQPERQARREAVVSALTSRELAVLRSLAAGRSNREIGVDLHISEGTVKTHVSRILNILSLRDRVQAVVLVYETGLALPTD
ncbi:MAG: response regulator transcription factor [Rhodococcus sp. (in: high G+C Gram-positive bacteria)]|uniref:response regulator transcription factor n=1 Tax=Rhodococcus sp. TaxID=1831 RepID=UPI002AD6D9B3|nr:response regulator transcription factor [Rhodococcus sp. (in: high G+C Gram-positive bacteria)]